MRPMDDAIDDRVRDGRIAEVFMPAVARQLTRDNRGPRAIAVVEDLQQILALGVFEPDEPPIIEDQHLDPRKARQHGRVRPVAMREREFRKEPRQASIDHPMALTARLLAQGAGEKGLADAGRTSHIVPIILRPFGSVTGGTRCMGSRYACMAVGRIDAASSCSACCRTTRFVRCQLDVRPGEWRPCARLSTDRA